MSSLRLMSHALCPYVQRAVISLTEKGAVFDRTEIDLADKPYWFLKISPLGKTPVLVSDDQPVFESAPILEYLEDTQPHPLHPACSLERARHRAWIEFGSAMLNNIAGFYNAPNAAAFDAKIAALSAKADRLEDELQVGPYFADDTFSLVDAVFGPVFRYFDTFDKIGEFGILAGCPELAAWRAELAARPSVAAAVGADYPERLMVFLSRRKSYLARKIAAGIGEPSGEVIGQPLEA
ncbi:glutathione S-transferase family protein [uncultured Roseobacter sp.]|uniref:glutathione S-transferase family protein n=1 Tax=uncultured Roseobacter sp. TaxID=114847 RepID=UPI002618E25F|nr:glutathione S-transferase family protein [uncultured Roseobacter sp.]